MVASLDSGAPPILYIAGYGRSGSTVLSQWLGYLPGVVNLGEVTLTWQRGLSLDERCGCGAPFSQCTFWSEIGDRAFGGWERFDRDSYWRLRNRVGRQRNYLSPLLRRADEESEYARLHAKIYRAAAEATGARTIVDSSKQPRLARMLVEAGVDTRICHVVRDPRGVANSWMRRLARPEAQSESQGIMTRRPVLWTALNWRFRNAYATQLRRSTAYRLVRYEDFVDDPHNTLRSILADLELVPILETIPSDLGHMDTSRVQHTVSGNPTRFAPGPPAIRADEKWREELQPGSKRLVDVATWPIRSRLGYSR